MAEHWVKVLRNVWTRYCIRGLRIPDMDTLDPHFPDSTVLSSVKWAETVNISNIFTLYSLRWNIFMYEWSRTFLLSLKQAEVAHQQDFRIGFKKLRW